MLPQPRRNVLWVSRKHPVYGNELEIEGCDFPLSKAGSPDNMGQPQLLNIPDKPRNQHENVVLGAYRQGLDLIQTETCWLLIATTSFISVVRIPEAGNVRLLAGRRASSGSAAGQFLAGLQAPVATHLGVREPARLFIRLWHHLGHIHRLVVFIQGHEGKER